MIFTFGNWIAIILMGLFVAVICGFISCTIFEDVPRRLITALIAFVLSAGLLAGGIAWYNTHTASGLRAVKDYQSEIDNGIQREIVITAEDGREIFRYSGKVDIESNHEDNYIKFDDENGKRYIIYYGITDTITIIEQ